MNEFARERADQAWYRQQRERMARQGRRKGAGRPPQPLPDVDALPRIPDDEMRRYLDEYFARNTG